MIPKPTRLTKIVRKIISSGRVTTCQTFYTISAARTRSGRPRIGARRRRVERRTPMHPHFAMRLSMVDWRALVAAIAAGAVTLGAQQRAQEPPRPPAPRPVETLRPEILGTRGIVAAGRHYSVSAGVRIMQM